MGNHFIIGDSSICTVLYYNNVNIAVYIYDVIIMVVMVM